VVTERTVTPSLIFKILYSAHKIYFCNVSCSRNKMQLFPHIALIVFYNRHRECLLRGRNSTFIRRVRSISKSNY